MTNEKQADAALKAYRQQVSACVDQLKKKLDVWICQHGGEDVFRHPFEEPSSPSPYYTEVTSALLETGIDREIHLLGESDARDMLMRVFERRAKAWRQRQH